MASLTKAKLNIEGVSKVLAGFGANAKYLKKVVLGVANQK
jgi:hypothetical protein